MRMSLNWVDPGAYAALRRDIAVLLETARRAPRQTVEQRALRIGDRHARIVDPDLLIAIFNGRIRRRFTRDLRGTRYEVVGRAIDGREIAIICRIKATGKLLFITTYALE